MERPNTAIYCPLCGGDNRCALTRGGGIEDCWCAAATIDRAALAAVPPDARGQACLCPACGRTARPPGHHVGDHYEG
ncbi:cysteine-rich CWC family protein [Parahaliea mediterranea]|uniref:cysteine-rich CWC family protein n=1 Tax=Parahaliea mediterranea TaxID=651086 RepID=UPI000E2F89EC|nr:cysteine-rich CWC family protein [Parahaliea mediterranea]